MMYGQPAIHLVSIDYLEYVHDNDNVYALSAGFRLSHRETLSACLLECDDPRSSENDIQQ